MRRDVFGGSREVGRREITDTYGLEPSQAGHTRGKQGDSFWAVTSTSFGFDEDLAMLIRAFKRYDTKASGHRQVRLLVTGERKQEIMDLVQELGPWRSVKIDFVWLSISDYYKVLGK